MLVVRYTERSGGSGPAVGLVLGDRVAALEGFGQLAELWSLTLAELRRVLETAAAREGGLDRSALRLLAPADGRTEVWACGVTYEISRSARVEESRHAASVYELVYDAERPELFFKSAAWRVAGDGEPISVREDSTLDVPEPEVALVCNRHGEIVGLTACNDVSSRSIEGENPLYLPQAKIYLGGCALGPGVVPIWEVEDPYDLAIELEIERAGSTAWKGSTSTAKLHRRYDELVEHLFRADRYPDGAVLTTGTCLVPEAPFSIEAGDVVRVGVAGVGTLSNPVVRGLAALLDRSSPELRAALGTAGAQGVSASAPAVGATAASSASKGEPA
ncbi:MAG TPA: fumarylacetoacetate hydrolase family protein [Acidimicrobiales bacterium]|nr:fumarylacetoacetate hydrolase family protein [Acidimicrobiales bacterium]